MNHTDESAFERLLSQKQLLVWNFLQSVHEANAGAIVQATGVARPTVNQVLDKLLRHGKIERIGQGRATRYRKIRMSQNDMPFGL